VSTPADRLTELLSRCHDDPDLFNSAVLGRDPYWSGQREIARSVCQFRITVAYTGNAVGKDYLVGGIVPWWLFTRHESLVVVTGPSQTLLGSVTWKEIRRAIERSALPLSARFSQGIKASPQTVTIGAGWQALGYSTTSVERASGQHNRRLLAIAEEASGIEDEAWDALDSLVYDRLLVILNPIRSDGRAVDLIRQAEKDRRDGIPPHLAVNAIRIPSTESPHAHLEKSPVGLASRTWLEDCYRRYGKNSLWVRSHIDARIPEVSSEALFPEAWLDWAASRPQPVRPFDHPVQDTRRLSCDLGEGVGRDSTCIVVRDDWGVLEILCSPTVGLPEAAQLMAGLARKYGIPAERCSYDRLGIGRDLHHLLTGAGLPGCVGYAGESSPQSRDFTNLRTEAAFMLRRRLDPVYQPDMAGPRRPDFQIPPGPFWDRLRTELRALTYDLVGRQTRLIPKKDLLAKLGHSPDIADALIQSFAFNG
jgi:hypothetical protein